MADYGLRVRDSSGNILLTLTDKITRLRYSNIVSSTGNVVLSDIDGKSTLEFGILLESGLLPLLVTRSGTTINWVVQTVSGGPASGSTLVLVFLYT